MENSDHRETQSRICVFLPSGLRGKKFVALGFAILIVLIGTRIISLFISVNNPHQNNNTTSITESQS